MRFEGIKPQVQDLLVQHEIVKNIIQKDIKGGIKASSGCIPKGFFGDILTERLVKPIYHENYYVLYNCQIRLILGCESMKIMIIICLKFGVRWNILDNFFQVNQQLNLPVNSDAAMFAMLSAWYYWYEFMMFLKKRGPD